MVLFVVEITLGFLSQASSIDMATQSILKTIMYIGFVPLFVLAVLGFLAKMKAYQQVSERIDNNEPIFPKNVHKSYIWKIGVALILVMIMVALNFLTK